MWRRMAGLEKVLSCSGAQEQGWAPSLGILAACGGSGLVLLHEARQGLALGLFYVHWGGAWVRWGGARGSPSREVTALILCRAPALGVQSRLVLLGVPGQ